MKKGMFWGKIYLLDTGNACWPVFMWRTIGAVSIFVNCFFWVSYWHRRHGIKAQAYQLRIFGICEVVVVQSNGHGGL